MVGRLRCFLSSLSFFRKMKPANTLQKFLNNGFSSYSLVNHRMQRWAMWPVGDMKGFSPKDSKFGKEVRQDAR